MPLLLSRPATVVVDVAAWAAIHAGTGYLVHRLPARLFERDLAVHRLRAFEGDGSVYVRVLRIRRWKRLLPEAGGLFAGGFDKRHLRGAGGDHLRAHLRETRRAELGHWLATAPAPLFVLWNPPAVGAVMIVYAVLANGPCIAAQRYNRLRLQRVLDRREARAGPRRPASGSS
ncbi:MAG TPA: hypothetical protein VFO65_01210 [Acidimicrobiales bacterium]|nr:hypothetical protein [Acidimicrobiales bacterium]